MESIIDTMVFCIVIATTIAFIGLCIVGISNLFWKIYFEIKNNNKEDGKHGDDASKRK